MSVPTVSPIDSIFSFANRSIALAQNAAFTYADTRDRIKAKSYITSEYVSPPNTQVYLPTPQPAQRQDSPKIERLKNDDTTGLVLLGVGIVVMVALVTTGGKK